jgi:Cof subfamily protein (haloacid dehalogenase superfamily)
MKSIFLDIDGTLVASKGTVPDSAIQAIRKARDNGHKVILCTGRAMSEIYPHILEIKFDGIVACGGNYVTTFDEVLYERSIPLEDLKEIYTFFDQHKIEYYAEANSGLYTSPGCDAQLQDLVDKMVEHGIDEHVAIGVNHFRSHLIHGADLLRHDITKISFMGSDTPFEDLRIRFGDRYELFEAVVPFFGPNSGEISLKGTDKTVGMEIIMEHFGIPQEHTIAVGDGNNDITMLKYVHTGVAMGNGTESLKAIADMISDDVNEDGLANAFKRLGLVD